MTRRLFSSLFVLTALVGCGGADEGRPEKPSSAATATVDDACESVSARLEAGLELQPILDFEPLDGMSPSKLFPECAPETPCSLYFIYDSLLSPTDPPTSTCDLGEGVALELNQKPGPPFAYPLPEPRCGESHYAYHQQAKNLSTCVSPTTGRQGWGATLNLTLNANPKDSGQALEPTDASEWDGLAFWVKLGEQPSNQGMLLAAVDPYTSRPPVSAKMDPYCSVADGVPDAKKCDAFALAVLLEPQWRFVTVPFSLMQQKGFGAPSPLGALDASQLLGMSMQFSAGDWDVWVDDLSLYREAR